ncbi:hypothetical protein DES39_1527 [Orbus hercynius]|uniref:Toxin VasX N-terminal region domain-containing protein n=1 Tax=Orbus hercynius TaxID=593135 RepID=A0A495RFE1_9GAMM|nr:toxin VasX [Orbus hercynius]RKS86101.1 hypothetical protein DES39_1527 [Orbus hercynius]
MDKNQLTEAQKQQQKLAELEDKIIYEESEKKGSALASGGCGVCARKGFPIFLARKAPISKDYAFIGNSDNIVSLASDNREPNVALSTHRYVYRTLRTGYVYILVYNSTLVKGKKIGWEFLGYEVTPSGVFRHKKISDLKERNVKEIPTKCTNDDNHHIPGSFITIDTSVHQGEAYIAYTRRAWSQGTIDNYLKLINNETVSIELPSRTQQTMTLTSALKRFTKITLNAAAFLDAKQLTQSGSRSFAFSELKANNLLLELAADPNTIHYHNAEKKQRNTKGLITAHQFNSLRDIVKVKETCSYAQTTHVIDAQIEKFEKSKKYQVPVVVIEDPFGVAEELSLQRQLKVEPVTQMVVEAETRYSKKLAANYDKVLSSTSRLDTQFDEMIAEYKKNHESEAGIMYEGEGIRYKSTTHHGSGHMVDEADGDYFLSESYYKQYNSVIESGISYGYFNEKRLHLRKTFSLINEYRNQIESTEMANAQDIVYYDYQFTGPDVSGDFIMSDHYLSRGYEEVGISEADKKTHLAEMNKGWFNLNYYYGVRAFRQNGTAFAQAEKKIAKERAKYDSLLASHRESEFISQEQQQYAALTDSINLHSQDFFHYLTWLFGYRECSKYAPKKITVYNDCYFWLIECDTNASNNHVGYLSDFLKLIDFTCLGDIRSPEQTAVWEMLLNNHDSIYYRLLDGQQESLWQLVLNLRLENLTSELSQHTNIQQALANNKGKSAVELWNESIKRQEDAQARLNQQTEQILQKFETKEYAGKLDGSYFWEKGRLMLELYSMLVARASSGIANRPYEQKTNNDEKANKRQFMYIFAQSALVIRGDILFYFQLQAIPATELHYAMRYFAANHDDSDNLAQINYTVPSADAGSTTDWDFVQVNTDAFDLLLKLAEIANDDAVRTTGTAFAQLLKTYFTLPPAENELDAAIRFAILDRRFKDLKIATFNKLKADHGSTFSQSITDAKLNDERGTAREIKFAAAKLLVAGLNAVATQMAYSDNLEKLADAQLGETLRTEIKRDVTFGFYKVMAGYTNLVNEALGFAGVSIPNALRTSIQTNVTINSLTNGVFKTTAAATAFLGVVTSLITIAEGFFIIQKGMKKVGKVRDIYIIAGSLQMLAGVASLIQSVGLLFFAGPIGLALFVLSLILGVAASIVLYVFKDESEDWDKMQTWFNRCLFGQWQYQHQGQPYPPTYDGMAIAVNDYLVARMKLNAVIQLEKDHIYYAESMRAYSNPYNNARVAKRSLESLSRELYISLALPNYRQKISEYEGAVRLFHGKSSELVTLGITKGESYPELKLAEEQPTDLLIKRGEPFKPVEREVDLVPSKVGKVESYADAINPQTDEKLGYFQVFYKVGEYHADGDMEVYLQLKYWPQGKRSVTKDKKTVDNKPLFLFYTYKHSYNAWTGLQ